MHPDVKMKKRLDYTRRVKRKDQCKKANTGEGPCRGAVVAHGLCESHLADTDREWIGNKLLFQKLGTECDCRLGGLQDKFDFIKKGGVTEAFLQKRNENNRKEGRKEEKNFEMSVEENAFLAHGEHGEKCKMVHKCILNTRINPRYDDELPKEAETKDADGPQERRQQELLHKKQRRHIELPEPVRKSPLATNNLLEDTDGLILRGATQSISALSMR